MHARCITAGMPARQHTYSEVVRRTVIEPERSGRSDRHASHEVRARDPVEQKLLDQIHEALAAESELDLHAVEIDVDRDRVILRGEVATGRELGRVARVLSEIPGIGSVVDELVISPTANHPTGHL